MKRQNTPNFIIFNLFAQFLHKHMLISKAHSSQILRTQMIIFERMLFSIIYLLKEGFASLKRFDNSKL